MSSLKFRVLIDLETSDEVFRDIHISTSDNFEVFYRSIMSAFGFNGDQLASFYLSNDDWDKGPEIALMDMGSSEEEEISIMSEKPISELIDAKGQKMVLVYDFMRMWCFLIEVIDVSPENVGAPEVLLSVGDAPDEESKAIDFGDDMGMSDPGEFGDDIDDIFGEFDEDSENDDFEFDSYDDYDM